VVAVKVNGSVEPSGRLNVYVNASPAFGLAVRSTDTPVVRRSDR